MEWIPLTFKDLAQRVNRGGWRWQKCGRRLQLVAPEGTYDFKLQGRAYIRLVEPKKTPLS